MVIAQRCLIMLDGLVEFSAPRQHLSKIVVGVGTLRQDNQRLTVLLLGNIVLPALG